MSEYQNDWEFIMIMLFWAFLLVMMVWFYHKVKKMDMESRNETTKNIEDIRDEKSKN